MRKVLIQLIGGQTLPNLLSILMVKPDSVVNIYTNNSSPQHKIIKSWCERFGKKYGVCPQFVEYAPIADSLSEIVNDIDCIFQKEVDKILKNTDTMLILNMTGGTKLMSFAAMSCAATYSTSLKAEKRYPIPSFYQNPTSREIEFLSFSSFRSDVLERDIRDVRLSVAELIAVQGEVELISYSKGWETVYPLAKLLRNLAEKDVYFNFEKVDRDNYVEKSKVPFSSLLRDKNEAKLEKARNAMKKLAIKIGRHSEHARALNLCGVESRDGDFYLNAESLQKVNSQKHSKRERLAALYCVQSALNFFEGGWWEVIVAHAFQVLHPQAEVLWSAVTANIKDRDHGVETDVIASPDGHMLSCISCKRGVQEKVVQQLEQHSTRTAMIGGVINECIIAVYTERGVTKLKPLAEALKMSMWDAARVRCYETGKEYVLNGKHVPASPSKKDTVALEKTVPEATPAENPDDEEEEETMPAVPSFITRLKQAVSYVMKGKGM